MTSRCIPWRERSLLVDDPAHCAGRAAGVPRRLRARDADAVPADRDPDLSLVGDLRHDRQRHAGQCDHRRLLVLQHGGLLPVVDGEPRVFQHAGPGVRDCPADPQRRDQEVPGAADRHAGLSAAQPGGAQAGLLLGGPAAVCVRLFRLPRLLRGRLARVGSAGVLYRGAAAEFSCWAFFWRPRWD